MSRASPSSATPSRSQALSPRGRLWLARIAGLVLAWLVYQGLAHADVSVDARVVAAVGTLMALWWMTEALPLPITAMLPLVALPTLTSTGVTAAATPYANPIVFLFLGGFLIAQAMQKANLHRRMALLTLRAVGTQPRQIVLGMMLSTALLSMWVSNTATTLMMLPIGLSVLIWVAESTWRNAPAQVEQLHAGLARGEPLSALVQDPEVRRFGMALVLSIAWSASIGGLGSLLGSPPNAIVAGYISTHLGRSIGFADWMMLGVPLVLVFIGLAWWLITRVLFPFQLPPMPGGRAVFDGQLADLGPMGRAERSVLGVFIAAAVCWIVPGLLAQHSALAEQHPWLLRFNDTVVALAAGVLLFVLPGHQKGEAVLTWKDAERGLPWGVLLLFGGGLSLASAVGNSGLDQWFGQQVGGFSVLPLVALIGAVTLIVLLLTEITSNTATAATFIPILGGVAIGMGIDPMVLLIPAALAATCAFMLPVGTPPNAIVYASGLVSIADMARGGALLNVLGAALITLFTVVLGPWALGLVIR